MSFTHALVLTSPPIDEETGEPTQGLLKKTRDISLISGNGKIPKTSPGIQWIPVSYVTEDYDPTVQRLVTQETNLGSTWEIRKKAVAMTPSEKEAYEIKEAKAEAKAAESQGFVYDGSAFPFEEASKYNGVALGIALEGLGLLPLGTVPATLDVEAKDGSVKTLTGIQEMVSFWAAGLGTGATIATTKNGKIKNAKS